VAFICDENAGSAPAFLLRKRARHADAAAFRANDISQGSSSRVCQTTSLKDRLLAFAEEAREKATSLTGIERDDLLRKARQADTAAHINDWANSPGLQSPK